MTVSPKNLYGFVSVAETLTWTGLIVAMVLRYGFGQDVTWFFLAGMSHGVVFLAYCTVAVLVGMNQRWSVGRILAALAIAIPPYLTIPFDRSVVKKGLLEGAWRTEASSDPRDARFPDPLFRWFIARPLTLIVSIIVFLGVLLSVLLALGSPREWGAA
jgi:integral membrane protein